MNQEAREIPSACYGVLERVAAEGPLAEAAEQVRILGYATIDSGYKQAELQVLSQAFDEIREPTSLATAKPISRASTN